MLYFFFSSRRRHTRCSRDWSSDVCSSDLPARCEERFPAREISGILGHEGCPCPDCLQRYQKIAKVAHKIHLPEGTPRAAQQNAGKWILRSEEHTSELQSRLHLVCRLLLEKKKNPRIS